MWNWGEIVKPEEVEELERVLIEKAKTHFPVAYVQVASVPLPVDVDGAIRGDYGIEIHISPRGARYGRILAVLAHEMGHIDIHDEDIRRKERGMPTAPVPSPPFSLWVAIELEAYNRGAKYAADWDVLGWYQEEFKRGFDVLKETTRGLAREGLKEYYPKLAEFLEGKP